MTHDPRMRLVRGVLEEMQPAGRITSDRRAAVGGIGLVRAGFGVVGAEPWARPGFLLDVAACLHEPAVRDADPLIDPSSVLVLVREGGS